MIVLGLLPRYVSNNILGKSFELYLQAVRKSEDRDFIDLWDRCKSDRCMFSYGGLHLNAVRHSRLGTVLDESIKNGTGENTGTAGRVKVRQAVVGRAEGRQTALGGSDREEVRIFIVITVT